MPYLNSWRRALVAMALLLAAVPGLRAQEASSIASAPIRGDVDGDGRVTRADADALRAYLVRGTLPSGRSILPAGDANGDGRVTAADAALISRFAAGLDVSRFPVGRRVGEGPSGPASGGGLQTGDQFCTVDFEVGTHSCREVQSGGASVQNVILGTPYVTYLTNTVHRRVIPTNEDTTLYTVAIKNETPQPLGTTDGENLAAGGIRLFMTEGPTVLKKVSGSGATSIRLELADGTATFTNQNNTVTFTNRLYFQYDEVLAPEATSAPDSLRFVYSSNVIRFSYAYRVSAPAEFEHGWITVAPATPPIIGPTQTTTLTATVYNQVGDVQADGINWTTSDPAVATVNSSGVVTGVGGGTATITATSSVNGQRVGTRAIQVIQAVADAFSTTTTGNVRISSASTSPVFSVLTNDVLHGASIVSAGWGPTPNKTLNGGDVVMNTGTGTFTYNPPAGFDGSADSLEYTIQTGTATSTGRVALPVSGMIWFVNNGGAACTSRASGCGRLTNPYSTLAAFQAENNGTGNNPAAGDNIFLYESASSYTGPVTLLADQKLIGQDAGASLSAITSITPATGSDALPGMNPGANAVTIAGASGGVVLGSNNLLRGFALATTGGTALFGNNFGTPAISEVTISASAGPAISLQNGTVNSTFANASSTGSTSRGISLTSVNGQLTFTAGSISGAAQSAFFVSGGDVDVTWPGTVSQANNAALVDVQSSHNGTLAFSGTLGATNGAGLQFNAAQGIYSFSGTTTLGGNDAGIDITNGSGGTFTFGTGTAITNSAGTGVNVYGSAATVTYSGNITKSGTSTGRLVEIGEQTGGTVTFNTGTLSANSSSNLSTGISLSNADGTVTFAGPVTLSGGDAGVDIVSGSSGNIDFNATTIQNPANEALRIFNGAGGDQAADVTFAGSITTNAGRPVLIEDVSSGSVAVSASINATAGLGMLVQNNSGGTMTFSNATQSLNTAANAAVTLANNTGATVNFTGGSLVISTANGAGFNATGGGTVNVTGTSNTVTSTTGTAVTISSTIIGSTGVRFRSVSANGAANGIFLNATGNTGGQFLVTGDGSTPGSGGTIQNTAGGDGATGGNGVYLNGARNVNLSWMALSGHANNGLFGTGVRGLTMNKMRFTGNNGTSNSGTFDESAVNLVDLGGAVKVTNSRFDGGAYNAFRVENSAGTAPALDSLVVENDSVEFMQGSTADVRSTAILVNLIDGTADVRVRNNRVTYWWGAAINVAVQGTASATTRITNNFADNTNGALAGAGGIVVAGGNHAYNISGNTVRHTDGTAISADRVNFGTNMNGTITGNIIGVSGDNNSGSRQGAGIFVSHHGPGTTTHRVSNNTIRQTQVASGTGAIWILTGDASGFGGSGTLNATIVGNDIQESGTPTINAHSGILATIGTSSGPPTDTDQVCLDIGGSTAALRNNIANFNTAAGAGGQNRIRVNQRFGTTTRFPGYTGTQLGVSSQTDLATYLLGRNTASNSTNANTSTGGFNNTSPAGSACPQPTI